MGLAASYLQRGVDEERMGMDWAPESSRRARVIPLYAALRMLGRSGLIEMIARSVAQARRIRQQRISLTALCASATVPAMQAVIWNFDLNPTCCT